MSRGEYVQGGNMSGGEFVRGGICPGGKMSGGEDVLHPPLPPGRTLLS